MRVEKRIRYCYGIPIRRTLLRLALVASCLLSAAWIDPFHDQVSEGNAQFHDKKFNVAKTWYNRAEAYAPGEEHKKNLSFNKGDAEYMLENTDGALARYEEALKSDDKEVQKKAFFNMGNAYVRQKKYKEAVQSYINALNIDPGYEKAKKNIEYLLKHPEDDKQKDGQGGGKSGDKGQDKNKGGDKDKDKDKNSQNQAGDKQPRQGREGGMSKAQIKNMLDTMKQNPVRRYKGKSNDTRSLEKPW